AGSHGSRVEPCRSGTPATAPRSTATSAGNWRAPGPPHPPPQGDTGPLSTRRRERPTPRWVGAQRSHAPNSYQSPPSPSPPAHLQSFREQLPLPPLSSLSPGLGRQHPGPLECPEQPHNHTLDLIAGHVVVNLALQQDVLDSLHRPQSSDPRRDRRQSLVRLV